MKKEDLQKDSLNQLNEIHAMMERSSRFISLSGLSGILAGITALIGGLYAYVFVKNTQHQYSEDGLGLQITSIDTATFQHIFIVAIIILAISLFFGISLTIRKAKKNRQNIWGKTSQLLLINTIIPLATGGIFCLLLFHHGLIGLIAPATLLFYGLALINGSKYTVSDIRYLGFCELILGLLSSYFIGYGLLFWAMGFGVLHIVYGTVMYFKYDRA